MTFPGEEILISGKVIDKGQDNKIIGEVFAANPEGEIKLSGTFEAKLPS